MPFPTEPSQETEVEKSQKAVLEIINNPGVLKRGLLMVAMIPFLMFSGCGAIGTFFIAKLQSDFFATALPAEAVVLAKRVEFYRSAIANNDPKQPTRYQTLQQDVFDLRFTDATGKEIKTAIAGNSSGFVLSPGSDVKIYYAPENPQEVRYASQKQNLPPLLLISKIMAGIFLALAGLFYLLLKRKNSEPSFKAG